jgi:small subunit ribosomal protein S1
MAQRGDDTGPNSFAELFEASLSKPDRLQPGQRVDTRVAAISNTCVFLELSGKSEGVLDRAELLDKDGVLTVKEGDPIIAFFLHAKDGEMVFTTKIAGEKAGSALLENAFKKKIPVEGMVEKEIKGGYEVKLGETRAFCPYSQMGQRRAETPEIYVGKRLTFKIQEYRDNGRSILVSNRIILDEAQQAKVEELKKTLKVGQLVKAPIESIQDFGAFVDLGGVRALLPVSEIGRERVADIRAVLAVGQEIEAAIIKLDWAAGRITLSLKSLLADPWVGAAERYPKDSKHSGRVVRVAEFGAFVSLESGLDGLVHVSEFKSGGKYGNSGVPVKQGDVLTVQILDVDVAARRIALKPTSSLEEDATTKKYLESDGGSDTYNPFAALLKKK